jgi:beta-lactamase class A
MKFYYRLLSGDKGIYVENLSGDVVFSSNSDKKLFMGAMVRFPVLISLYYLASKNKISLMQAVGVNSFDVVYGPGVLKNLVLTGPKFFNLRELAAIMMQSNDATATELLIKTIGTEKINVALKEMGIEDISVNSDITTLLKEVFSLNTDEYKFKRAGQIKDEIEKKVAENQLPDISVFMRVFSGKNYATASSVAMLFKKLYKHQLFPDNFTKEVMELLENSSPDKLLKFQLPSSAKVYNTPAVCFTALSDGGVVVSKDVKMIFVLMTNYLKEDRGLNLRRFVYITRLAYESLLPRLNAAQ